MNAQQKFDAAIQKNNSLVCVGLDAQLDKLPKHIHALRNPLFEFNKAIIDATHDLVATFKPNIAFYEAYGIEGLKQLKLTVEYLRRTYANIPVLLDAKRADIGNTSKMYAKSAFEYWEADAVTVYPYPGLDAIQPFFDYADRMTILLIRTSNPGAARISDLKVGEKPFYLKLAEEVKSWDKKNAGIFVGATYPSQLKEIREIFPNGFFLSAGLGAQEGDILAAVQAGIDKDGGGIVFNASRSIIYASEGKDFAEKARDAAEKLRDEINQHREINN